MIKSYLLNAKWMDWVLKKFNKSWLKFRLNINNTIISHNFGYLYHKIMTFWNILKRDNGLSNLKFTRDT